MSHGNSNGLLYTKDDSIYVNEIWEPFNGENCETLIGKPKIFLVQACRGCLQDVGALYEPSLQSENALCSKSRKSSEKQKYVVSTLADILIYFSSAEGYPSFRGADGSWFVQALCAALKCNYENQVDTDLMKICTQINRAVAYAKQAETLDSYNYCKQMPVIMSMLTKTMMLKYKK